VPILRRRGSLPSADLYFTEKPVPGGPHLANLGCVVRVRTRREGHIIAVAGNYHYGHGNGVLTNQDRIGAQLLVLNMFTTATDAAFGARLAERPAHDAAQAAVLLADEISYMQSLAAPPEQPSIFKALAEYAADMYDAALVVDAVTLDDKAGGESIATGWRTRMQKKDDAVHSVIDGETIYTPHVKAAELQGGEEAIAKAKAVAAVAPFLGLVADAFDVHSPDVTLELKAALDDGSSQRMHPNAQLQRSGRPIGAKKVGVISATNLVIRMKGARCAEELGAAVRRQVGFHSDRRDTALGVLTFVPVGCAIAPWPVQQEEQRALGLAALRLRGGAAAKAVKVQAPKNKQKKSQRGRVQRLVQRYVPV